MNAVKSVTSPPTSMDQSLDDLRNLIATIRSINSTMKAPKKKSK